MFLRVLRNMRDFLGRKVACWSTAIQKFAPVEPIFNEAETNRPFYRYDTHIELIRFKGYYRMPRGHEHISFVFSGAFRDIFS